MKKIKNDFIFKELQRLSGCAAGLTICLLIILKCCSEMPLLHQLQKIFLFGIAAVISLSVLRMAVQTYISTRTLTDNDTYLLEKEYTVSHPVYNVWQGEIHLMKSFVVCRNRGRLLFIPVHNIERVEKHFDHIGIKRVPLVKFIMDTGKSISIGFPIRDSMDNEAVFSWFTALIGSERVT